MPHLVLHSIFDFHNIFCSWRHSNRCDVIRDVDNNNERDRRRRDVLTSFLNVLSTRCHILKATLYSMQPFQDRRRQCTRSQFKPISTHCWRQRHSVTASATYAMLWRRDVDLLVPAGTSMHSAGLNTVWL
jgi:hypothetical protein